MHQDAMRSDLPADLPADLPEQRLRTLIARCLNLSLDSVDELSNMHNTRRWDSLRHMLLMAEIESDYGIALTDDEIAAATSVAKIRQVLGAYGR